MQGDRSLSHIDVRLCGSIPRKDLVFSNCEPCSLKDYVSAQQQQQTPSLFHKTNASTLHKTALDALSGGHHYNQHLSKPVLGLVAEPPSWACAARGETRLEPVCDSVGRQAAVDLTQKACFRIGRSPNSDIQLMHATSSRRHAMVFHHANGSCYVVDCGSAHGTFVNGVRIASPSNGGVVVPHKVKRGALIRFGGPGAPAFLLKSFNFCLSDIESVSGDLGEIVRRNTWLNALGKTAAETLRTRVCETIEEALVVTRKRSFDSLDSRETTLEDDEPCKRMRCSSPVMSPLSPLRLVSPDLPTMTTKRVTFASEVQTFFPALVTPDELSSEEDNDSI
jgi:hypothetical protein